MATGISRWKLFRPAVWLESRAVQSRLLTVIGLVVAGGLLTTLAAMGGGLHRDSDALEDAFAARAGLAACETAEASPEAFGEAQSEVACAALLRHSSAQITAAEDLPRRRSGLGLADAAEPNSADEPPARSPTYIRVGRPTGGDAAEPALPPLRGAM